MKSEQVDDGVGMQRGVMVIRVRRLDGRVIEEVFGALDVERLPRADACMNRPTEYPVDNGTVDARPRLTFE